MIRRFSTFLLTIVAVALVANIVGHAQSPSPLTRHVREVTLSGRRARSGGSPQHSPCASSWFCRSATRQP
jgi:hypothetical protein